LNWGRTLPLIIGRNFGDLKCILKIVKLGFQFYIFEEEIAIENFIHLGKKDQSIFCKSSSLVIGYFGHYQPN